MTWPTLITIVGTQEQSPGVPASGYITYQLNAPLTNSADGSGWATTTYQVPYNSAGVATATVPVIDDATTTPTGAWYTVSPVIKGAPPITPWKIQPLTSMGASVALGSITPVVPVGPVYPYAVTNSPAFTGTPTAPTAPPLTNDTQLATTAYADAATAVAEGLAVQKASNLSDLADAGTSRANLHVPVLGSCQAVATANTTLSGTQTVDGYAAAVGDQILCTAQTTASQNGPWVVAAGAWTRPTDYASEASVKGRHVQINGGTLNGGSLWALTTSTAVTVDTTATTWASVASRNGSGVARFIARARAGNALKIAVLGDSILAGTGATPGVNDQTTVLANGLASTFTASTFTANNQAVSGSTTASLSIRGGVATAIAANADLYIIGFGRNDIVADPYPGQLIHGYAFAQSMREMESMIRGIRSSVPQADILLVTENPFITYSADALMRAYQAGVADLAKAYGCELADTYGAFAALGDYSALMFDSVHPNVAGHALSGATMLAHFPASLPTLAAGMGLPTMAKGTHGAEAIDLTVGTFGWTVLNGSSPSPGYTQTGSGWNSTYPRSTSNAGDYMEFTGTGIELDVSLDASSASMAVVNIAVDGVTVLSNQSLSTVPSTFGPFFSLATGLTEGSHVVRVTLVSGTLTWYQAAWLAGTQAPVTYGPPAGLRRMKTGRYYSNPHDDTASTISVPVAGEIYIMPLWVPTANGFDRIAISCTTLAAGSTVQLGVYSADSYDQPASLLLSTAALSTATTGWKEETDAISIGAPGYLWLAAFVLGGSPRFTGTNMPTPVVASASATLVNPLNGYYASGQSALPATWTSTVGVTSSPLIALRST